MSTWIYVHDLDPIIFTAGPLRVGWYGTMYAVSFLTGYWYYLRMSRRPGSVIPTEEVPNLLTYIILGSVLGGRLGWVLFYGGTPYLLEPWRVLETWKGGMSFHGGLLGFLVAMWVYARRHGLELLKVGDFVLTWVPVGLFFGRIGNFINGELYGKPTDGTWGVVFPSDGQGLPRHPSQLYEALLEGALIFLVLSVLRDRVHRKGLQPAVFLLMYGLARITVEFVRLPDADIGYLAGFVTMGMVLSLPMVLVGAGWIVFTFLRIAPEPPPPAEAQTSPAASHQQGRGNRQGQGKKNRRR
ncbi:MAG: prolipoprotein diacylglyceryl transferase [Deltaproteobacteria bacterium]|nr:prolipoprotein diacylglyceryl transferase [Deltaproteobacteria bacterium]